MEVSVFLQVVGKAEFVRDLGSAIDLLEGHSDFDLEDLQSVVPTLIIEKASRSRSASAPNSQLVNKYLKKLEESLGDDVGFPLTFDQLKSDKSARAPEIAAITKRFIGTAVKTKAANLKKIWSRHHALMTSRAQSASRDGRSAA